MALSRKIFSRAMQIVLFVGVLLFSSSSEADPASKLGSSKGTEDSDYGIVAFNQAAARPYSNGAGPLGLFRIGRSSEQDHDLFGLVDPTLWRIQFFTLKDWSIDAPQPLRKRLQPVGSCRLDPRFRLWRIHQLADRIVLQGQPKMELSKLNSGAAFDFDALEIMLTASMLSKIESLPFVDWDKAPTESCGDIKIFRNGFLGQTVSGGGNSPFVIAKRGLSRTASSFLQNAITIPYRGRFLASVQELESAKTLKTSSETRHFLLTSRKLGSSGFAASEVSLIRRGANAIHNGEMRILIGQGRVKAGQRNVAISSTGEVLILGTNNRDNFYLQSCTFAPQPQGIEMCALMTTDIPPIAGSIDADIEHTNEKSNATLGSIWSRAWWYASQEYSIDASAIPSNCRQLKACSIDGVNWAPLAELRLAYGVVKKLGVPYAQSVNSKGRPTPDGGGIDFLNRDPLPARFQVGGETHLVSDIENSLLVESAVPVFGIDCSQFVSSLWKRRVLTTAKFVDEANIGHIERIRGWNSLRSGDALVINLSGTINHIVVFREARFANQGDSSRAILVAEASSACGGACYTFYDESFFHGWALIGPGTPQSVGYAKIPRDLTSWKDVFAN